MLMKKHFKIELRLHGVTEQSNQGCFDGTVFVSLVCLWPVKPSASFLCLAWLFCALEDQQTPPRRKSRGLSCGPNLVLVSQLTWIWCVRLDSPWLTGSVKVWWSKSYFHVHISSGRTLKIEIDGSPAVLIAVEYIGNYFMEAYPKMVLHWSLRINGSRKFSQHRATLVLFWSVSSSAYKTIIDLFCASWGF